MMGRYPRGGVAGPGVASGPSGNSCGALSLRGSTAETGNPMEASVSKPQEGARLVLRRRAPMERRVATSLRLRFMTVLPRQGVATALPNTWRDGGRMTYFTTASFVAQRLDGILACGAQGGPHPEQESHRGGYAEA